MKLFQQQANVTVREWRLEPKKEWIEEKKIKKINVRLDRFGDVKCKRRRMGGKANPPTGPLGGTVQAHSLSSPISRSITISGIAVPLRSRTPNSPSPPVRRVCVMFVDAPCLSLMLQIPNQEHPKGFFFFSSLFLFLFFPFGLDLWDMR